MKEFYDRICMVKTKPEVDNMRVAGQFTEWTFSKIVEEVEDIIEEKKSVKHSVI
jgi:hypothetical protein